MNVATNSKPINGKFFQVLGFDLLVDEDLNTWLLEINDHPSLNIYLEKDYMGGGMGKSLSLVDQYVKKTAVGDAIKLAKKSDLAVQQIEHFRSLTRIFPDADDDSHAVYETINNLK